MVSKYSRTNEIRTLRKVRYVPDKFQVRPEVNTQTFERDIVESTELICRLLNAGFSNKDVARLAKMSPSMVRQYRKRWIIQNK